MKPIWRDGKLTVELHKPDEAALLKARDIGAALVAMHQDSGQPIVDAIDDQLGTQQKPEEGADE